MAEIRQLMIGHVVAPLLQFAGHQADKLHREELIALAVGYVDRQTTSLGAAFMRTQDTSDNRQTGEAFREGKAYVIAKRATIGQPGEENATGIDGIAILHVIQHQEQ